ncbi:hypothetical protein B0J12DRAFT_438917 [Macrophomina phaseolina]|uniref:Uncharacterized protein n=1 Tax=Macrophomina phaseolina TaxID=35725 RepID=A0ABQ8GHP3_9PEZI|nr:hypothetical protein B0J12DRAFT_438917 [Macrophomina phaseolina]
MPDPRQRQHRRPAAPITALVWAWGQSRPMTAKTDAAKTCDRDCSVSGAFSTSFMSRDLDPRRSFLSAVLAKKVQKRSPRCLRTPGRRETQAARVARELTAPQRAGLPKGKQMPCTFDPLRADNNHEELTPVRLALNQVRMGAPPQRGMNL